MLPSELSRLLEISARLRLLNSELASSLAASRDRSLKLQDELDGLKKSLNELRTKLGDSETRSIELEAELEKAESSLQSLTASFDAYRIAAQAAIEAETARADRAEIRAKWGRVGTVAGIVATILALIFK